MSAADMQLVRGAVPGGYNLAVGEPFFLQTVYGHLYPRFFTGNTEYPPLTGDQELVTRLRQRYGGQHVVVTNGAKQALLAACHAFQVSRSKDTSERYDFQRLYHPAPFWPTYPTIADLSGLGFTSAGRRVDTLDVVTSPNNPDGDVSPGSGPQWHIWDAAYASRIYGWDGLIPYHKVSVWSAAKLYGVSGYRIGWLVTPDEELAILAAQYVEKTTSGVALPSQDFLKQFLANLEELSPDEADTLIAKARQMLADTSRAFLDLQDMFIDVQGCPINGRGMFAWVRATKPARFRKVLDDAKVKVVDGSFCGGSSGYFRVSLGVTPETMRAAVKAIQEADSRGPS